MELQYCKMKKGTPEKTVVSVDAVSHWRDDSLYVRADDIPDFLANYGEIFQNGLYSNMERGGIDACGINYYSPAQLPEIIKAAEEKRPAGHALLCDWLERAALYNGIYILGV